MSSRHTAAAGHGDPSADLPHRLRELAERIDLVMRATNDGLWDWDLDRDQIYFSPRWKSMLGYEEDEIPNRFEEWQRRVHPDDHDQAVAAIEAHLAGETASYELEHRLLHRDGSYRWILARGAALRDEAGRAYRIAGSHTDITLRKEAEAALAEREAQYRSIFESSSDGLVINDLETGAVVEANPAFCRMHGYTRAELLNLPPDVFIHPDSRPLFSQYLDTVRNGGEFHARAVDVRKDGSLIDVEVHGGPSTFWGRPSVLGIVRDVTEHVRAYQLLEQRVEERTRQLASLLDVSNIVASTLDRDRLLGLILDQLQAVAEFTGASILTVDADELEIMETRGASARSPMVVGIRFPLVAGTPIADVISRREPVIVADVRDDSLLARAYRGAVGDLLETPAFAWARSWLAVPMVLNDRVTGILSVSHKRADFYTPQHARLATAIANQAAVAIENARLYEQAQGLAALEERQRLARELHDSVTQSLFSMTMISGALPRLMDRDLAAARERTERLNELAHGALAEMRALIFELRPESLEREGLIAALEKQAAALKARHNIAIDLALDEEPDVSLETKEALYRIAQEAMHNTVKHAKAARIELSLTGDGRTVTLEIRDDGAGFDPSNPSSGLGQRSMRERAARLKGTLEVISAPGAGCRIRARVPLV